MGKSKRENRISTEIENNVKTRIERTVEIEETD